MLVCGEVGLDFDGCKSVFYCLCSLAQHCELGQEGLLNLLHGLKIVLRQQLVLAVLVDFSEGIWEFFRLPELE